MLFCLSLRNSGRKTAAHFCWIALGFDDEASPNDSCLFLNHLGGHFEFPPVTQGLSGFRLLRRLDGERAFAQQRRAAGFDLLPGAAERQRVSRRSSPSAPSALSNWGNSPVDAIVPRTPLTVLFGRQS
jgi:hypothetical protein